MKTLLIIILTTLMCVQCYSQDWHDAKQPLRPFHTTEYGKAHPRVLDTVACVYSIRGSYSSYGTPIVKGGYKVVYRVGSLYEEDEHTILPLFDSTMKRVYNVDKYFISY